MIDHILHISDILIKDTRRAEYVDIFDAIYEHITPNDIVVCTGNIFEITGKLSPGNIDDFFQFFQKMASKTTIVLLPGANDFSKILKNDLISPLLRANTELGKNIIYCKKSGLKMIEDIPIYAVSPVDFNDEFIDKSEIKNKCVAIYHGDFPDKICNSGLFSFVLCGGREDYVITDRYAYSGSIIQQSFNETKKKGLIKYDLKYGSVDFIELINKHGEFLRLMLRNDMLINVNSPEKVLDILIDYQECTGPFIRKICDTYQNKYKIQITRIINSVNNTNQKVILDTMAHLRDKTTHEGLIEKFFAGKDLPNEMVKAVKAKHEVNCENIKYFSDHSHGRKWSIESLSFSNLFCFGENNNVDFRNLTAVSGISGVIAENQAGKSSILDIMVFILYNKLLRGGRDIMLRNTTETYSASLSFVIKYIGKNNEKIVKRYKINRTMKRKKQIVEFYKGTKELSGKTIENTYSKIAKKIGSLDNFLLLCASLQNNDKGNFLKLNQIQRKNILHKIFGLDFLDMLEKMTKSEIKEKKIILISRQEKTTSAKLDSEIITALAALKKTRDLFDKFNNKMAQLEDERVNFVRKHPDIQDVEKQKMQTLYDEYRSIPDNPNANEELEREYENLVPEGKDLSLDGKSSSEIAAILAQLRENMAAKKEELGMSPSEAINIAAGYKKIIETKNRTIVNHLTAIGDLQYKKILTEKITFDGQCASCQNNSKFLTTAINDADNKIAARKEIVAKYDAIEDKGFEKMIVSFSKFNTYFTSNQELVDFESKIRQLIAKKQNKDIWAKIETLKAARHQQLRREKIEVQIRNITSTSTDIHQFNTINENIAKALSQRDAIINLIGTTLANVKVLEYQRERVAAIEASNAEIERELNIAKAYLQCLDYKQGIPYLLLRDILRILETNVNTTLQKITNFKILIDDDVDISIVMPHISLPIEMCSGYQHFIISIIFKVCLGILTVMPMPNCLIIDEGFGCLDETNIANVCHWLSSVKSTPSNNQGVDFVFIISHIEALQSCIKEPLFIRRTCGVSRILNPQEALPKLENIIILEQIAAPKKVKQGENPLFIYNKNTGVAICTICNRSIKIKNIRIHERSKIHQKNIL
ncbi:MAG: hypothetical protein KAS12_01815 [Candidatus Aenigmarchaeota archaeon]|nr:hypothetical protein [Candidatus Aenigmarchaeota archaeon]